MKQSNMTMNLPSQKCKNQSAVKRKTDNREFKPVRQRDITLDEEKQKEMRARRLKTKLE